jgi:hypothetical protein
VKGLKMKCIKMLSLLALIIAVPTVGCSENGSKPMGKDSGATTSSESVPHTHGHGPNGGVVFDLGKYHGEFTVDHDKRECMIVVLGDDEKTPTAVATAELTVATKEAKTEAGKVVPPMTIAMKAQEAASGKASKFVGADPGLGNVADFEGTVMGEIDGKPSQGEFKE